MATSSGRLSILSVSVLNILRYAIVLSSSHYVMIKRFVMLILTGILVFKWDMILAHRS